MQKIPIVVENITNDLEVIDKVLSIYSIVKNKKLRPFERLVMKYYIKYGYGEVAKEYLIEDANRRMSDLKTADYLLRDKGFLVKNISNEHLSKLSEDMEVIRKHFVEGTSSVYLVSFKDIKKNAKDNN